jgi:hypothetical protein
MVTWISDLNLIAAGVRVLTRGDQVETYSDARKSGGRTKQSVVAR